MTYFVADEMPFESLGELRTYLLTASNDFFNIWIGDCAAKDRVEELMRMMTEVIAERAARTKKSPSIYQFGIGAPPECPWSK